MKLSSVLLLASASAFAVPSGTSFLTYTGTKTVYGDATYGSLSLTKFNPAYGALTAVEIIINELSVQGPISVESVGGPGTLTDFTSTITLRSAPSPAPSIGFSTVSIPVSAADGDLTVRNAASNLPISFGYALASNTPVSLTVDKEFLLSNQVYSIASTNFSQYTGPGSFTLQLRNSPTLSLSAPAGQFSTSDFSAFLNVSVKYTYTVVPEPSTYGVILGGLGLAVVALRRRQRQVAG